MIVVVTRAYGSGRQPYIHAYIMNKPLKSHQTLSLCHTGGNKSNHTLYTCSMGSGRQSIHVHGNGRQSYNNN